jgi:DNA-binding transcriptional ArsR family regulator
MPFTAGRPITEAKADLFKALGHPSRVRVLELLAEGELSMGELAKEVGIELAHLSQHVTLLRRAGIVDSHRVRNTVVFSQRVPQIAELLAVARGLISRNLRQGQALLAALDDVDDAVSVAGASRTLG